LKMEHSSHEVFFRDEKVVAGSDRSFGLVMAAALAAVTSLNAWHLGRLWPWTGGLAALLLAAALLRPAILHPLNLKWLLDRAEASWSIAGDDERSVLKDRTWILLLSFGGLCVSERNSGCCRF
jgi:hypothetical protein